MNKLFGGLCAFWSLAGVALAESAALEDVPSPASLVLGAPSGPLLFVVILALVVAFAITGSMKAKLKTAQFQSNASSYVRKDSLSLHVNVDQFLYETVERRKIEPKQVKK